MAGPLFKSCVSDGLPFFKGFLFDLAFMSLAVDVIIFVAMLGAAVGRSGRVPPLAVHARAGRR